MPKRPPAIRLFDRLRRGSCLRGLFVVAALLSSQNSLACALEELLAPASEVVEVVMGAATEAPADDCCGVCFDCAHCGCCVPALGARAGGEHTADFSIAGGKKWPRTAAPGLWTPPTLLKPPIGRG
jgi:hypothetical protein